MKFLADENIPLEIVNNLKKDGLDIISLSELNPGISDEQVLHIAIKENRILITFDTDFGKLVFKNKEKTKGVILLRINSYDLSYIESILNKVIKKEINFEESFCVVESDKLRVINIKS